MTLVPLPLGQIRPTGWFAARLRDAWEAGLPEGSVSWIRHAMLVGEGRGKLLVRSWAKRAGVVDAAAWALPPPTEPHEADRCASLEERAVRLVWADPLGLRVALYGPAVVKTEVGGVPVELELETEALDATRVELRFYPESPVEFTLFLRLPEWASGCLITGEGAAGAEAEDREGWMELRRRWNRGDSLSLSFDRASPVESP